MDDVWVCIAHGRFIPCRKDGEHRWSKNPYWVKAVRDYQNSPIDDLTWEPAWEHHQKMWVRRTRTWWEVGCQCCGRIVHEDWSWRWAFGAALEHARFKHS